MIDRVWLPLTAALLLSCSTLHAQPAGPHGFGPAQPRAPMMGPSRSSAGREAAAAVSAGLDKLFEFMRSDEVPNQLQTAAFLDREIAPYFDFDYMAEFVAGPDWARMTPAQHTALAAQLESRMLGGLTGQLLKFRDQKVRFLRPRPGKRGSIDVQVGLASPGAPPARYVFRLYSTKEGWKIFDVLAEGRSLLAFYREAFERLTGDRRTLG
ncbi:MAG: ABC transporter substrate-binding protein [Thiohalocapsa sp.]|jgi:phospholipid transport system substrate-binding protein|nr:ABC transporter substrate-binding protein [Thiohalocapsa sp.]